MPEENEDKSIKVSLDAYLWLTKRKASKGIAIRFSVDEAVEALQEKEKGKK